MKPAIEPVIRMRPRIAPAHVVADLVDQVDRAGDVGVDDLARFLKVLVKESAAKAAARVGHQKVDRTSVRRSVKLVDALCGGQVGLHGFDLSATTL